MDDWIQMVVTIACSVIASSGFWAFFQSRFDKKNVMRKMLIGLAHDRIVELGMTYIERGDWITQDEYENLHDYLYVPYEKMKENGSAGRIMQDIAKLRICKSAPIIIKEGTKIATFAQEC